MNSMVQKIVDEYIKPFYAKRGFSKRYSVWVLHFYPNNQGQNTHLRTVKPLETADCLDEISLTAKQDIMDRIISVIDEKEDYYMIVCQVFHKNTINNYIFGGLYDPTIE